MTKLLRYIKWVILTVLIVIILLWLSYFLDSLNKSQHHFFGENNSGLTFLNWVNKITKGALVLQTRLFDDNFYIEDFPMVSIVIEVLFIALLVFAAGLQRQKWKQYVLKICVSIGCFVILFEFLDVTLKLFVPG